MERRDGTDGGPDRARGGSVARVGDDPVIFTLGMITIGLVLGVFIGLLAGDLAAPEETAPGAKNVREDLDALAIEVDVMTAIVVDLDARAASSSRDLVEARARLDGVREDLMVIESTLQGTLAELDRRPGPMADASSDMDDIRNDLMDVQMELVDLQLELDDLIAQIIAGGGSGGSGEPTVPENATLLPSPHLSHYRSPLLDPTCGMCHDAEPQGEAIVSRGKMYWNGSLDTPGFNTVIDRTAECKECHGLFPETGMEPSYIDVSCVACHDDWADRMTAVYVKEGAVTGDDCLLCHGGANAFIPEPQEY